jgi:crotonobetainyl-CoA:carnitine CoA-transferase CaiB-like acyl-CoA transferase
VVTTSSASFRLLEGVRVLEFDQGIAQYAGKILADAGADVIKVEPLNGAPARNFGPFLGDVEGIERSLSFWHYNTSKRSIAVDFNDPKHIAFIKALATTATVVLDGMELGELEEMGIGFAELKKVNPTLIYCSVTPFGLDGPWAGFAASDLIQLAAGGLMSVCGYDGEALPDPVAPTGGQSRHIAGMMAAIAVIGALVRDSASEEAQWIDVSAHESIAVSMEMAVPFWLYQSREVVRHTARHAVPVQTPRWQHRCRDGKYFLALPLYIDDTRFAALVEWFESKGLAEDLGDETYRTEAGRAQRMFHVVDVIGRFCAAHDSAYMFRESQARRLPWAPVNSPEDLFKEEHFVEHRKTFVEVVDGDGSASHQYVQIPFLIGHGNTGLRRAPLLGEHTEQIKAELQGQKT